MRDADTRRASSKRNLLSNEFKVACAIFELGNIKGEKVWYNKLKDTLIDEMSGSTILKTLKFLSMWGIVKSQFGETDTGRAGKLLYISGEDTKIVRELYETYWRD